MTDPNLYKKYVDPAVEPITPANFTASADDALAIRQQAESNIRLRSVRRAIALNAVETARDHRGERDEPFTQADADTVVAIMELLERVAGG